MTIPASLLPYQVLPKTPKQVFAGVPPEATLFLAFPDDKVATDALVAAGLAQDDGKGGVTLAPSVDYMGGGQKEVYAKDAQGADTTKSHPGVLVNVVGLIDWTPPKETADAPL